MKTAKDKPILHARACFTKNPFTEIGVETEDPSYMGRQILTNIFGEMPTAVFKAANLNLTFDDSEESPGEQKENGIDFSGMIGMVQRNESDFAVYSVPLEAFDSYKYNMPVRISSMTGEDPFFIMSAPRYNRTVILFDIEDSILEIGYDVMIFYVFLFAIIHIFVTKVCSRMHRRMVRKLKANEREEERAPSDVAWSMITLLLHQGSGVKFNMWMQTLLYYTFECAIGILIVLYLNHMRSDMVAYSTPNLIDTLEDVWNAPDVKPSFMSHASVAKRFKDDNRPGSVARTLYERSLAQWEPFRGKVDKDGGTRYLHTMGSDELMKGPNLIKDYNIAFFIQHIPAGIIRGLECKDLPVTKYRDDPVPYSQLYMSKEPFMVQHVVHITTNHINLRLAERLNYYEQRLVDHGFDSLIGEKGGETAHQLIPMGKPASPRCLNEKEWDDPEKEQLPLGLDSMKRFVNHMVAMAVLGMIVLIGEYFAGRWSKGFKRNGTKAAPVTRGSLLQNEQLTERRRRRSAAIQEVRKKIQEDRM